MAEALKPVMSAEEMAVFFHDAFPDARQPADAGIKLVAPGRVLMTLEPEAMGMRPGNLVSGPTQMGLADRAAYAVIIAHIGPVAMAVTSNLNFSFLRGVERQTLYADARLLKLGRRLATVDVVMWQGDESNIVAQSTVTYAIPS